MSIIGKGVAMISRLLISATLLLCVTPPLAAQTPVVVEKDVTVLGFKLHYREAGGGLPVVLLHGLGGDGSRWEPNIGPLAVDFHVIAPARDRICLMFSGDLPIWLESSSRAACGIRWCC